MDERTKQTFEQMKQNPAALQHLLASRDGQMLMQMMNQQNRNGALQQAATNAMRGDTSQMMQMVNQLMQSPEGAALVERINKAANK